jgi:hypothetical protein
VNQSFPKNPNKLSSSCDSSSYVGKVLQPRKNASAMHRIVQPNLGIQEVLHGNIPRPSSRHSFHQKEHHPI